MDTNHARMILPTVCRVGIVAIAIGLAILPVGCRSADRDAGTPEPPSTAVISEATATSEPTASAQAPASGSAPAVDVTNETGESYCYVKAAFNKNDRRYVVLDYIELGADLGMSEDYEIINNNPKLRTFEVTSGSYLGAFWMAVDLYGNAVMDEWSDESNQVDGVWRGTALAWDDLVAAVDDGTANDYSYWQVVVADGRVRSLVNTYQD